MLLYEVVPEPPCKQGILIPLLGLSEGDRSSGGRTWGIMYYHCYCFPDPHMLLMERNSAKYHTTKECFGLKEGFFFFYVLPLVTLITVCSVLHMTEHFYPFHSLSVFLGFFFSQLISQGTSNNKGFVGIK